MTDILDKYDGGQKLKQTRKQGGWGRMGVISLQKTTMEDRVNFPGFHRVAECHRGRRRRTRRD